MEKFKVNFVNSKAKKESKEEKKNKKKIANDPDDPLPTFKVLRPELQPGRDKLQKLG